MLLEVIGEDRVMLGTDYPFPLGEVQILDTYPGKVITDNDALSEKTKVKNYLIFSWLLQTFV